MTVLKQSRALSSRRRPGSRRGVRVATLALACLAATACKKAAPVAAATTPAPIVLGAQDIATARTTPLGSTVAISGTLQPATSVSVRAQVAGTVTDVHVDRGTHVTRGEVIAVIQAQGIQSQALGATAAVSAAQANLALAQQKAEASKKLYDAGAISALDYKTAQTEVDAQQAQLTMAKAQATNASEQAGRATVTAPITGVVSVRTVSGGEAVRVGDDLFTIVDASQLELAGQIGVQEAARVQVGQPVTFTLEAYPKERFTGTVARMDPAADPATRQVGVYVRMPNPGGTIVGGQYSEGHIATGAATTAVAVPTSAVTARTGNAGSVFVVVGNRIAKRAVTVGAADAATGLIAIVTGIQNGDRVVVNPSSDITDGTLVTIAADSGRGTP